jgi:LacI family transcriptional regulator
MRVRIKDVAARAGVSAATVSVVLNDVDSARVAPQTRDRVRAAASELGYTPNNVARGLRTQRTHTIGLVTDHVVTTPYAGRMILGAQEAAWEAGFVLMLVSTGGDEGLERESLQALIDRQVDGLIYATMYHRVVDLPPLLAQRPSVVLDSEVPDGSVPYVVPDEERGGYDATRLLLEAGHRRIAYLRNADPVRASHLREDGYRRALGEAGIPYDPSLVVTEEALSGGGQRATETLLSMPDRPTGVFVFNDRMSIGVYRAARRAGLTVPDDLSVVGFDDQELIAAELDPGLSTVALPHHAMGRWAARRLVHQITTPDPRDSHHEGRLEPCRVVTRGSVGPPPETLT